MKIYLASSMSGDKRDNMEKAVQILRDMGHEVYNPCEHVIPHAWDYPNDEWGLMVFINDVSAITDADVVVALSYGRVSTAGVNWEMGFAFGIGKKVIVVEMTDEVMSLMVANGRWATVKGLEGLQNYDFSIMPKLRSKTEQK